MLSSLRNLPSHFNITYIVVAIVLALAFLIGMSVSWFWLVLLFASLGVLILLRKPALGLAVLIVAPLAVPFDVKTGTEVMLNVTVLLIPFVTALWLLDSIRSGQVRLAFSLVNRPLTLFLLASLLSLIIGRATWDALIPISGNFLLVQLAQWAVFALSALAFWMTANLVHTQQTLWRFTALFLLLAGGLATLRLLPGINVYANRITTVAFIRAPLWELMAALSGGQLLWNQGLSRFWRIFLAMVVAVGFYYGFFINRESSSTWVGIGAALGTLVWLRWPRLRWGIVVLFFVMVIFNVLFPALWQFAGGDEAWVLTGGSRLALIERVVNVTMRNPVTGLGPAAYRPYANATPLLYENIYWLSPSINSHNNYVDLFAHGGLLGLALFFWFVWEIARLGLRLRQRFTVGFAAGYLNGVLAAGVSALVLMAFADWILPFVYNIGFPGFQASVLIWLFLGGLVALDQTASPATA